MQSNLYVSIKSEKQYSLLQGEFIPQNHKILGQSEVPIVIDRGTLTVGTYLIDMNKLIQLEKVHNNSQKN